MDGGGIFSRLLIKAACREHVFEISLSLRRRNMYHFLGGILPNRGVRVQPNGKQSRTARTLCYRHGGTAPQPNTDAQLKPYACKPEFKRLCSNCTFVGIVSRPVPTKSGVLMVQFTAVYFGSVQFSSVKLSSVQFGSV